MVKASKRSKKKLLEEQNVVEDLDLGDDGIDFYEGGSGDENDEHAVVYDKRKSRKQAGNNGAVLPSDAHKVEGYDVDDDERGAFREEEELANAAQRAARKRKTDDDFDVLGISKNVRKSAREAAAPEEYDASPVIEAVERDFASLSTGERLDIIRRESPELLKMLEDMRKYLDEVKALSKPLHELLFTRRVSEADKPLVSFLETKVQLMLSYCIHVAFYLLLKTEGKKVSGHPVVDSLVEIRVYLEKLWPLEKKLQYTLNKLLTGQSTGRAARLEALRPISAGDSGVYEAPKSAIDVEARDRRRQQRALREAEDLENEELSMMHRTRTKQSTALRSLDTDKLREMKTGYNEDEDQFFSKMAADLEDEEDDDEMGDDSDDEGHGGQSLIEKLRKRQNSSAVQRLGAVRGGRGAGRDADALEEDDDNEDMDDFDDDEVDMLGGGEDEDMEDGDVEYDALVEEEQARGEQRMERSKQRAADALSFKVPEVDRRKAGKKIESHRGLTKARPKDRKNPRIAQRRKYEKGMRIHKAQVRQVQPEPEGGFVGVASIKPHVTRSHRL